MLWQKLIRKPKECNYIFCINPGRSGSNYLADILDTAKNAKAFHEPEPAMISKHLTSIVQNNYAASYSERRVKLEGIHRLCRKIPAGGYYIETNHMFIKTFYDVVMQELPNIQVIHLQREMSAVLKSFVEMNYFTDKNKAWPHWMTPANAVTRAIELPIPYESMDQFDKSIAYLIDIEARAARFRRKFPDTPLIRIRLDELNDANKVTQMFETLGLRPTKKTYDLCGVRTNTRQAAKTKQGNPTRIEDCRQRLLNYFELLDKKGITQPEGIYFDALPT